MSQTNDYHQILNKYFIKLLLTKIKLLVLELRPYSTVIGIKAFLLNADNNIAEAIW